MEQKSAIDVEVDSGIVTQIAINKA
jgi:hypothetical protein